MCGTALLLSRVAAHRRKLAIHSSNIDLVSLPSRITMELRQLTYAVAVADERHFTRAAARLHTAQPAISHQIRKLELELGIELFERSRLGTAPTAAGEVVLARARRVLIELEALREEVAAIRDLEHGQVELGAVQNLGPLDLAALMAAFHAARPGIDVRLREVSTDAMYALVAADQLDLAVAALDVPVPAPLEARTLLREPLILALPAGHRLARRKMVRVEDLADDAFVAFPRGTGLRAATERIARDAGFEPHVHFETSDMTRLLSLVAHGLGVTLIPASASTHASAGLQTVRLRAAPHRSVGVVWRRDRVLPPAASAFRDLLLAAATGGAAAAPQTAGRSTR
jgi:DNA-binding transcriptional LysR family regulator